MQHGHAALELGLHLGIARHGEAHLTKSVVLLAPHAGGQHRGDDACSNYEKFPFHGEFSHGKRVCARYLLSAHSITSLARPSNEIGTVMPSARAVLRLTYSSTLVACWTGRSAGFSPLRTRPV